MATPSVGAVVLVPFPFSDLSSTKLRPAVVLADVGKGDYILCQVTSKPYADPQAIEIRGDSFTHGNLHRTSYARPGKLFTANDALIAREVGTLKIDVRAKIVEAIEKLLRKTLP